METKQLAIQAMQIILESLVFLTWQSLNVSLSLN